MKPPSRIFTWALVCFLVSSSLTVSETFALNMAWQKTFGGTDVDVFFSMVQTSDGGFAMVGYTKSFEETSGDCWLVKTDSDGNMVWNKTYGGEHFDQAMSVVQTSDGGFAMAGLTGRIGSDFLLVRTDPDGNLMWNRTFNAGSSDVAFSLVQTSDGGFAIAGSTSADDLDCWLGKTDSEGNLLWNRTFGDAGYSEEALSLVQTQDGGFAFTAMKTFSEQMFLLVKTDSNGKIVWNQTYSGGNFGVRALIQTNDGGYAMAGTSFSESVDFGLAKTDGAGNMLWNKGFTREGYEAATSLIETSDGGLALVGFAQPVGGETSAYMVRTDSDGNMRASQTYGEDVGDHLSVVQTGDGSFAIAGSLFVGDEADFWLLKTNDDTADFTLYILGIAVVAIAVAAFLFLRRRMNIFGHNRI